MKTIAESPHCVSRAGIAMGVAIAMLMFVASCSETRAPVAQAEASEWQLTDTLLQIGNGDAPETEFHRVAGAVRLSNGEIAIVNGGTMEVRYFGPDGQYRRTFGKRGAGPGEFRTLGRPIRSGDTLTLYDAANSRLTMFLRDSLLHTLPVRATGGATRFFVHGRLSDGRWLAASSIMPAFTAQPYRDSIAVAVLPASAEGEVQLLGWFAGPWVTTGGQQVGMGGFERWVSSRVVADEVVVLDANQEQFRKFSSSGVEVAGTPVPVQGPLLTAEHIARLKEAELPSEPAEWLSARYDPVVLPERLPFQDFIVDSEDMLWLGSYRMPQEAMRFQVIAPDGRHVASMSVPAGFKVMEIGRDYCLGVQADADGVESVVLYRLERASRS